MQGENLHSVVLVYDTEAQWGGAWSGIAFLGPEAAHPRFSLTEMYITSLRELKRSSPRKELYLTTGVSSAVTCCLHWSLSQPAQLLPVYLILYLGIWISFAQANPTWQW